jgi:hypothetical protein
LDDTLDGLLPLRAELLNGDLRPLYLARLAVGMDCNNDPVEEQEGPVPAGLDDLTDGQQALAKFYGLSEALIRAAARNAPRRPSRADSQDELRHWLERQPQTARNDWLAELMADPHSAVRREVLADFQNSRSATGWPTVHLGRTIAQLQAGAEELQQEITQKNADKAARQRAKKLSDLAADPERTLRKTEELVKQRSTDSYREAATLLADLREALKGREESDLPDKHARKLREQLPTAKLLVSELRRKGFLKK